MYSSVDVVGSTITGTNIPGSTTVLTAVSDPDTDALVSVTISNATTTSTIAVNTQMTIAKAQYTPSGYYIKFSSPVPMGKVVTVLHGFDK